MLAWRHFSDTSVDEQRVERDRWDAGCAGLARAAAGERASRCRFTQSWLNLTSVAYRVVGGRDGRRQVVNAKGTKESQSKIEIVSIGSGGELGAAVGSCMHVPARRRPEGMQRNPWIGA